MSGVPGPPGFGEPRGGIPRCYNDIPFAVLMVQWYKPTEMLDKK